VQILDGVTTDQYKIYKVLQYKISVRR